MQPVGLTDRPSPLRFGIFEVDLVSGELRRQGVRIKLQEQPFQALVVLIQHPHEVVTREDLRKRLWPPDVVVDFESGLNKAINRLREALGDDADNPRFIETLPQRGYRFLADVEAPSIEPPVKPPSASDTLEGHPAKESHWPAEKSQGKDRRGFLALAGGAIALPLLYVGYRALSTPRRVESIAVLPLENLSGNIEQEYFSDGMTDELIGEIARISSLRVISRTSVMRYKGRSRKSLQEIARELNVDAILEGTVMHSGQRVRITAQLIRAHDDRHLWSEQYERELPEVLTVQREVARSVASQIRQTLTPPQNSAARTRPVNAAAYDSFLKGNFFLKQGIRGIGKSVEYFKRAIEIDPSHAEAHAGLAEALCYFAIFGFRPSAETYSEARVAAMRALELDESNAGAHNALADVRKGYDWDFAGAEVEYKRALELNPSHLLTRLWYAECLARMGRYDEALGESERAIALDPVSPNSQGNRSMLLFCARRYDDAIHTAQQAIEFDPSFINALWWQARAHAAKRDFPKSLACLTKALGMNDQPMFRGLLGHVYGRIGEKAKALGILDELTKLAKERYVSPVDFAVVYAGLGNADSAFQWLEKACRERATRVHELSTASFDDFRSDRRYSDLRRRVGLAL